MYKQTIHTSATVLEWAKDVENSSQWITLCVLPNVVEKCLEFVLSALPQESLWVHAIQHFVTVRYTAFPSASRLEHSALYSETCPSDCRRQMKCDCNEEWKVLNAFDYVIEEMKQKLLYWTKLEPLKVKGEFRHECKVSS